ncbi:hypothetical protein ACIOGZ_29595 [Kitasatospora sp. NPDC088160]|uniref:hypothetical protein n=1 Tax=Kitasatospora sp. NPDC088160 TaxID=3364072 RepID=UPI00381CF0BA
MNHTVIPDASLPRAGGGSVIPLGLHTTDYYALWISTVLPTVPDAERVALAALATTVPTIEITTTARSLLVVDIAADGVRYRTGAAAADAGLALDTRAHRAASAQTSISQVRIAAQWMHVRTTPRRVRSQRPGGTR